MSMEFGTLLREFRLAAGLTREELGTRAGYSAVYVKKIESGERHPPPVAVEALANALSLAPDQQRLLTGAARPSFLPVWLTSAVGREVEVAAVSTLLLDPSVRLLTLTGSPGTGKTRLAVEVAHAILLDFADGVFFVDLAPLATPDLTIPTIAATLRIREARGQTLREGLNEYLHYRQLVLILDNFEHLLAAADLLPDLLRSCPQLKVVTTSRSVLGVSGEHTFEVLPLAVPKLDHLPSATALPSYGAISLFVERVRAIQPHFALNSDNAGIVAEICVRLEGLPLALELAAPWTRLLPLRALLERLRSGLELLTTTIRDVPARHRTLRAAIDWSYALLGEHEQEFFARLAVFSGGCTLEAATEVCGGPGVVDAVSSLVGQSLLRHEGEEEPRFAMLETIREYALERLEERGDLERLQHGHALYFVGFAEKAEPELTGPDQRIWLERLERERDNLRVALRWALDRNEVDLALRLAGSLRRFWEVHGHLTEGRSWLKEALGKDGITSSARAKALEGAGRLAERQGDYREATALFDNDLALCRDLDDPSGIANCLDNKGNLAYLRGEFDEAMSLYGESLKLFRECGDWQGSANPLNHFGAVAYARGDYEEAKRHYGESLILFRERGDRQGSANLLGNLAGVEYVQGNHDQAMTLYSEALTLHQELGDRWGAATCSNNMGNVAYAQGDYDRAKQLYSESLTLFRELGDRRVIAITLINLAAIAQEQREHEVASGFLKESLSLCWDLGDKQNIAYCLEGLAEVAAATEEPERVGRLFAAAETLREAISSPLPPPDRERWSRTVSAARSQLDEASWQKAWQEGHAMALVPIVGYALEGHHGTAAPR